MNLSVAHSSITSHQYPVVKAAMSGTRAPYGNVTSGSLVRLPNRQDTDDANIDLSGTPTAGAANAP